MVLSRYRSKRVGNKICFVAGHRAVSCGMNCMSARCRRLLTVSLEKSSGEGERRQLARLAVTVIGIS